MNALTMTLIAMLLSTALARTLKSACTDYQPPNYWGKCIDGEYKNVETKPGYASKCSYLIILVSEELVGNNTLTIETTVDHGSILQDLALNEFGYYSLIIGQNLYGPDITITFFMSGTYFRNGTEVHKGRYQQKFCAFEAGDIWTNDTNAVTYGGSYHEGISGHIIIKSFDCCL